MKGHLTGIIEKELYGYTKDDVPVFQYSLTNKNSLTVKIINYGGIITNLWVPDKSGTFHDVVLGFNTLEEYEKFNSNYFFGAIIGRYANRISNGRFSIDGNTYQLSINEEKYHNTLHGGFKGFHTRIFKAYPLKTPDGPSLILNYLSPDGEEGFPGNLNVEVRYILTNKNEFIVEFKAITDKPTIVNLTQHSYFNLSGSGNISNHKLQINSDFITPVNEKLIPTGEFKPVKNTEYDFKNPKILGKLLSQNYGYDINYVLNKTENELKFAAKLESLDTGISMEIFTTKPGLQLYTGNYLNGIVGKLGLKYDKFSGICLEPQFFPDSPNIKNFPKVVLYPNKIYKHKIIYKFK
ncbi:MAG: aldose 1-epimerase [Thermosipho sp. (in: thermotogales)]|nr:aldose 1-epimerase [Thermosipho sp. (in: thermotogales)]MDN5324960.1 aldose 1-epimerase [Thermosipho sp. (in: thermotogales)]